MTNDLLRQPRWLYIGGEDEQIHGPFTSTEMNNWLGGNFFQPNLMLKLIGDTEFYPLEQLVQACENENPFSLPGNSFRTIVTYAMNMVHHHQQQQRVQSVPISGDYSSLPATPSSTLTPGPGDFIATGVDHQFQQQQQPPPLCPPLVSFPIQLVQTSMDGQPLPPTQFLMMPPPLPTIGPNAQQIGSPMITGSFRPGPQPSPMFSPSNQQQQPHQPPIPVSISASGFFSSTQAAAFHHQFIQQSQQQQRAPQPIIRNGILPFPPPPPFSLPETRFPPPTLLQLQHQNHHHLQHSQQQNGTAELHHNQGGGGGQHQQQNGDSETQHHHHHQQQKEEEAGGTMGMIEASDSPDSGHVVTPCAQPDKSVDTDDAPWNRGRQWPMVDKAVGLDYPFAANTQTVKAQTETHTISTKNAQKWISQLLGVPICIVEEEKAKVKTENDGSN